MTDGVLRSLQSLKDVEGVLGSFVWSASSSLVVARDLPEYIDSHVLDEVGPRLERIYGAFEDAGDDLDAASLVFSEHKLHMRKIDRAFIAVLSSIHVNMPALKMALSLVGRRVGAELANLPITPSMMPQPPLVVAEAVAAPIERVSTKPVRYYRGNRMDP